MVVIVKGEPALNVISFMDVQKLTSRLREHIKNQHTALPTGCSNISKEHLQAQPLKRHGRNRTLKTQQEAPFYKIVPDRLFLCVRHLFEQACAREAAPSAWEPPSSPWLCSAPSLTFSCSSREERWLIATNTLQTRFGTSEGSWDLVYW